MTIQSGSVNRLSTKLSASLPPQVELCLNSCEYENTPHAMTYHNNHQVSKFSQVDSCVQTKPKKAQTSQCRYLSTFTLVFIRYLQFRQYIPHTIWFGTL